MKININKKIKKFSLIIFFISLIFTLCFIAEMVIVSKNSEFIGNINTELSLNVKDIFLKDNILCNESFDNKTREKYTPFAERAINIDLEDINKDIKLINIETNINDRGPSIQIDYDEKTKPSIIEVAIQSKEGEFYYWDYKIENNKSLNFIFPEPVISQKGIHYIQVNKVWKKNENLLGIKKYNFNINLI